MSCGVDQVREIRCGRRFIEQQDLERWRRGEVESCPEVGSLPGQGEWMFEDHRPLESDAGELSYDQELTALQRRARTPGRTNASGAIWGPDCCYSACHPVDVRPVGEVVVDYQGVQCLPPMRASAPSSERQECAAAILWPGDFPGHVAPLIPGQTRRPEDARRDELGLPEAFPGIDWCCYQRAPVAAIGPQ